MNKIIKDTIILFLITLISGTALAVVYEVTKKPIADAELQAEQNAYREICAEAVLFEGKNEGEIEDDDPNDGVEIVAAKNAIDANGNVIGYVVKVITKGYGGDVVIVLGTDKELKVTGMTVISASNESPGLGANCLKESFQSQFAGKSGNIEWVKGGGAGENQIDAISGATITTKAVTKAVNAGLAYLGNNLNGGSAE